MPKPPTDPESQNKISQEGNDSSTVLKVVLDDKITNMSSTVVADTVLVAPVRNLQVEAPFPLQIDVPPALPPQFLPPYTPPVPPQLPPPLYPEPLPLIAHPPYSSGLVSDKEDVVVVECHKNKWKEYVEEKKLKYILFANGD